MIASCPNCGYRNIGLQMSDAYNHAIVYCNHPNPIICRWSTYFERDEIVEALMASIPKPVETGEPM